MAAVVKCLVLVYLLFNVCYCSSPVNEPLETVMRVLNDCSRFYPNANRREVAVDYSVHRLVACVAWRFLGNLNALRKRRSRDNERQMRRSHEEPGGFLLVFAALSLCALALKLLKKLLNRQATQANPLVDSLDRGTKANAERIRPRESLVRQMQYLLLRWEMFALRAVSCTSVYSH